MSEEISEVLTWQQLGTVVNSLRVICERRNYVLWRINA